MPRDGLLHRTKAAGLTFCDVELWKHGTALLQLRRSKIETSGEGTALYFDETVPKLWLAGFHSESMPVIPQPRPRDMIY